MADKITNFEDYVRKEVRHEHINKHPKESEPEDIPVSEKTMEIEIEDPFQFLNAQERDEYLRQRQKELARESLSEQESGHRQRLEAETDLKHRPEAEPEQETKQRPDAEAESGAKHRPRPEPEREMIHRSKPEAEPEAIHKLNKEPGTIYGTEPGHKSVSESFIHSPKKDLWKDDVRPSKEEDFDEDDYEDEEFEEEYGEEYFRDRPEREKKINTKSDENKDIEKRSGNKRTVAEKKDKEPNERKSDAKRSIFKKADVKGADNRKTDVNRKDRSQNDDEGGINMDLVVRVASILTGIVILIFIAGLVKVKILDRFMAPDPDEVQVEVSAIPEGYTETGDTVVVTAQALNLRTVPSTQSDETIVEQVSNGTQIERLAVSDDGQWALLKWNGQQVYGYMKYMEVSQ